MTNTTAPTHSTIPMTKVESKKIHSYGYDAARKVLAVRFLGFKDAAPGIYTYEYPNVGPATIAALNAAESKGNIINTLFVKTKYPFVKLLATAHDPLES